MEDQCYDLHPCQWPVVNFGIFLTYKLAQIVSPYDQYIYFYTILSSQNLVTSWKGNVIYIFECFMFLIGKKKVLYAKDVIWCKSIFWYQ